MDRVRDSLPLVARKSIGNNVQRINAENRSDLARHLENVRDTNVTEEPAENYR